MVNTVRRGLRHNKRRISTLIAKNRGTYCLFAQVHGVLHHVGLAIIERRSKIDQASLAFQVTESEWKLFFNNLSMS